MLYPEDVSRLRWNPYMRRVENHAIFVERRGGLPVLDPELDPDGERERCGNESKGKKTADH